MRRAIIFLMIVVGMASAYSLYDPPRIVPRVDYTLGLVYLDRYRGDYFIGVEQVLPISEYLDYQLAQSVREAWQAEAQRDREKQELAADATGLIPDIQLPKLPLFGEGSKIDISGKDRITLGGRQTVVEGASRTSGSNSLLPELKMEQQLSVVLNGTIGERTKVNIDHDSEREESQNKVKLSYTGTEDEIIQSVELGDTRLTIPSTAYTGDLPSHEGLFGASAKGKVGGVDVYAIASNEQSQSQSQSFTGRRTVSVDTIYESEYVTRRFYHVDAHGQAITNLRVYVDDRNQGNNQLSTFLAIATAFPDSQDWVPGDSDWTYDRTSGEFDLLSQGTDYFVQAGNIIEFANYLGPSDVVGLTVFTATDTIGNDKRGDSLVLMLLKPEIPGSKSLTWDYEQRNIYKLNDEGVTLETLRLFRDQPEQASDPEREDAGVNRDQKFVRLLGLDPDNDGQIEYPEFEPGTGLIRFPGTKPFDTSALSVREPRIYLVDPGSLNPGEGRKYYMVAKYASASESYYLGQPDIAEKSEKVRVDGVMWSRDTDYKINYSTGYLTFVRTLPPDADIQVTYEYRPIYSVSQKSVVGTRAEWAASQQGKIGASVFYRSEGTKDEKPDVGSEPFSRVIAETDASYTVNSDAVSAFLDRLPLLRAQATSSFSAAAEGAVSLPDPNTRGVAYLDDFSGTTTTRDMTITALLWSCGSVPVGKDTGQFARTRLFWVNPDAEVRNDSVYGPTGEDDDNSTQDVLRVVFAPDDAGSWAGMMTAASQSGMSMSLKDIENLRMILRSRHGKGTIHVTVGMSIDEDAPRRNRAGAIVGFDGRNNTEDRNGNGLIDAGLEDTGLDGVFGVDSQWQADSGDDGDDDYDDKTNPMGTEGNNKLDAEDLDGSGFSRYNHYFECDIPLGDTRYFSDLANGWKLCRVSLRDSASFKTVGQPRWEDIRLVRVWFDGFDETDTIDFYSFAFTGSSWTGPLLGSIHDTTTSPGHTPSDTLEKVWVTQISRKTDRNYVPPFTLKKDASGNTEDEAALLFGYRELQGYRRATAGRTSSDRKDYREYRDLRLYVHDDGNGLAFLLRLGSDSVNYYEYRAPANSGKFISADPIGKWYEFVIPLDSFPTLKQQRDRADVPRNVLWSSDPYRMIGTPSLSDVRYTALGIENPENAQISGGLWFDDLRLTAPHKEAGYGLQARTSLALSDFVTGGVNFSYSDPNFRRFSESRGVKSGGFGTTVGANVRVNLDRLVPYSWGLSVPLSYSISDVRELPKYSPVYPDLLLSEAQRASMDYIQTGRSENIALDNVRKAKSAHPWLNYTLEGMGLSWRQRRARSHASLSQGSSWANVLQWAYAVSPDVKVDLGSDDELALLPQDIRFTVTDDRALTLSGTRTSLDSLFREDTARSHGVLTDFGVDYSPIEDLTFEYGVQTERDLLVATPDSFWFLQTGSEAGRDHSFGAKYNLEIADVITPGIDFNGDYSDERAKSGLDYDTLRNMNNSGDIEFTLGADLAELLAKLEDKAPKLKTQPSRPGPDTLGSRFRSPGTRGGRPAPLDTVGLQTPPPGTPDSLAAGTAGPAVPETPEPHDSTVTRSETPRRRSLLAPFRQGAGFLARVLEPVDLSYSLSRTSDLNRVYDGSPWHYRLGFSDIFAFDSIHDQPTTTRERRNTLRVSSGGHLRELTARVACQWSQGQDLSSVMNTKRLDRSITWPELDLTLNKVHNLFKKWATDSKLTASYRRQSGLSGDYLNYYDSLTGNRVARESLAMLDRSESYSNDLNPLVSWTTTWKKRISTTLSTKYTFGASTSYRNDAGTARSVTYSDQRGISLSFAYAFSAPQGLRLPFLKKVKLPSDLNLSWSLSINQTHRWVQAWDDGAPDKDTTDLQNDKSFSTSLSASYRFSRSIEAGLTAEYSQNKGLTAYATKTTDIDVWVLFKF